MYLLHLISVDFHYLSLWKKKHMSLPLSSRLLFYSWNHLSCITQDEKTNRITRLTSRQTAVGRQERINYCPLTVSFPAPELSASPSFRRDLLQYSISCTLFAPWTCHPRTEGQLLSFDCSLEKCEIPSGCKLLCRKNCEAIRKNV